MKRIFLTDWTMIPLFILTVFSGIVLHITGHRSNHDLWHNWAVCHILSSIIFLVIAILHVKQHWGWYKGIVRNGIGKKCKITVLLSAVFLLVSVTGFILLGVNGANSGIGLWHYKIGIVTIVFSIGHILKRAELLLKSLKNQR